MIKVFLVLMLASYLIIFWLNKPLVKITLFGPTIWKDNEYVSHKLYKFNDELPYTITKEDGIWIIRGKQIETLFEMTRFTEDESVERFARKLKGMGVDDELKRLGAKYGDEVQIKEYIFEFKE